MNKNGVTFGWEDPEDLRISPFNPPSRQEERKIAKLRESVHEIGVLVPIMVGNDDYIGDGNGRRTAAVREGIELVPVMRFKNLTSQQLFPIASFNRRTVKPKEAFESWAIAGNVGQLSRTHGTKIQAVVELVGKGKAKTLQKKGMSPAIWDTVRQAVRYVDRPQDREFAKKALYWLFDNKMTQRARRAMESTSIDPDLLYKAIMSGRLIKQEYQLD